jgi:hypothetical protein
MFLKKIRRTHQARNLRGSIAFICYFETNSTLSTYCGIRKRQNNARIQAIVESEKAPKALIDTVQTN